MSSVTARLVLWRAVNWWARMRRSAHDNLWRDEVSTYDFDLAVIGAGQGGLPATHLAANLGAHVALIETAEVGGT